MISDQEELVMSANASTTVITVRTVSGVRPWAMMKADEEGKNISQFFSLAMVYMMNADLKPIDIKIGAEAVKKVEALEDFNAQLREEVQAMSSAIDQKNQKIKELNEYVSDLQERLEASQDNKQQVEQHLLRKQKNASQTANKKLSDAAQEIANLKARLDKANARLKKEKIQDHPNGVWNKGVVVQY